MSEKNGGRGTSPLDNSDSIIACEAVNDEQLLSIIKKCASFGLDLAQYRDTFLKRRIGLRMRSRKVIGAPAYLDLLERDSKEREALARVFSVNVTEFLRDKELFATFREIVLPQLHSIALRRKHDRCIRIWCAGCASGEEPYTIALILDDVLCQSFPFYIYATDRNPVAIENAKLGCYESHSLRNVSDELRQRYFRRSAVSQNLFQVNERLKQSVTFLTGDIALSTPQIRLDAVFCRNVMIYMSDEMHQRMLKLFHSSLNSGGYLILGQSEMIVGEARSLFDSAYPRERIYRKLDSVAPTARPALS